MAKTYSPRTPRAGCKDPMITKIPHDIQSHGRIGHPKNILHPATGIALIYDPANHGWFRFGCVGTTVGSKEVSLKTHIFSRRDAEEYLDKVIDEMRTGKVKILTNRIH